MLERQAMFVLHKQLRNGDIKALLVILVWAVTYESIIAQHVAESYTDNCAVSFGHHCRP